MNNLQIFNSNVFGEIRTVIKNGEPWFVGKDIAKALGYSDTDYAIRAHVEVEDKQIFKPDVSSGLKLSNNGAVIINESGLYSLVFSSKLPIAKEFKRWVTSEVLPAIRKTGSYTIDIKQEVQRQLARELGKKERRSLTAAIKEFVPESPHKKFSYKNHTDLVYKIIFGKNAKQLKVERMVKENQSIRDVLNFEELKKVDMVEAMVKNYLYAGLLYEQIKGLLAVTFPNGVHLAVSLSNKPAMAINQ